MTKLQILNQYLTERLMVVVREILEVVGDTVSEYQEETTRTQRENECLRRRLREVVFEAETAWSGSAQPIALAVSGGMSPIEQQCCEEEWRTSEGQDTDPPLTAEKQELSDQQRTRLRKGELDRPDSVCVAETESECVTPGLKKLALEIAMSVVSPSLNVNSELNVIHIAEDTVSKMPSFNTAEPESLPSLRPDQVKTEPGEVDLKTEQSSEQVLIIKTQGDAVEAPYEAATNVALKTNGAGLRHTEESKVVEADAKADEAPIDNYLVGYSGEKHCFHCGKFFSQACNLKAHLQIHTGERPYTCNWCGKSFTQSADLRRHQRIHTGEKPHRCTWCEKSFTQIGNLKRHLRIHTGERPYSCNMCGKAFNDGDTLKKHKRVHTGERPFRCIYCPKTFTVASSLQNHLKNHTRDSKPQHT